MDRRVALESTKFGSINAWVSDVDSGFVAHISAVEYPDLPVHQAAGEPLAASVDEAVEQLRQALNRS